MKSKEDLTMGFAELMKRIREEMGLSMSKMADLTYIDTHTWSRYESGKSAPDVPTFIWMLDQLGIDALRLVLDFIYPDVYEGLRFDNDIESLRKAASHFFLNVASDRMVRQWDFLMFGEHGSNITPQMQEFTMIDHLPMSYRYAIAQMVMTFWDLAESRGELIGMENVPPDIELFKDGLAKGGQAAFDKKESYTTSSDSKV